MIEINYVRWHMSEIIKTGDYYLVARDLKTGEVFRIPIDRAWYIKGASSERIYGNDIAVIDYVTSKFKSKEELIHRLYTNHYINTENVDLYITHMHKYNQRRFITEYGLIFSSNDRVESLIHLAKLKINNQGITKQNQDANDIMNKLISKCYSNKIFRNFMTCVWSKMDGYVSEKITGYSKKTKINWGIKYELSEKTSSYLTLRNIIYMWNLYDMLLKEVQELSPEQQTKEMITKYIEILNIEDIRKDSHLKWKEKLDKNYIEGQINMEDYLSSQYDKKRLDEDSEENKLKEMFEEAEIIKNQPFDSLDLQVLEQKYGRFEILNHLTVDIIQSLSVKDRYILGFIDYVEYKNQMYNSDRRK